MVALNLAYTSQINPSGASPVLTRAQVWAGLQRKIRFAQEFVPVIESCKVLKDEEGVVTREVKFKEGQGPRSEAKEVVRCWADAWVSLPLPFHECLFFETLKQEREGVWVWGEQ